MLLPETRQIFLATNLSVMPDLEIANKLCLFKGLEVTTETEAYLVNERIDEVTRKNKSLLCFTQPQSIDLTNSVFINFVDSNAPQTNTQAINTQYKIELQLAAFAQSKNIDIGDLGTATSSTNRDCKFCTFSSDFQSQLIKETENFRVFVGYGCFQEGYLLVIPKNHISSFAELEPTQLQEYERLSFEICAYLKKLYKKNVLIWENSSGPNANLKDSLSIVHAHMHFMPIEIDLLKILESHYYHLTPVELKNLKNFKQSPYLLVRPVDNSKYYIFSEEGYYIPRQLVRQILGNYLWLPKNSWNWRIFEHRDLMNSTVHTLRHSGI